MSQDSKPQRSAVAGGSALALAAALAGGLATVYISAHLSVWAPLVLWLALAVSLLVTIVFLAHLLPGWLAGAAMAFTGALVCLRYALIAYQAQHATSLDLIQLLPLIGTLALSATVSLLLWRRRRQSNVADYDTSSEASSSPPIPYTPERIMVYADDSMLQRRALLLAAGAGVSGAALRWATVNHATSTILIVLGVLLLFASVHLALAVARLFMDSPTLIIGPEGILDSASLVATGCGLLRWDEVSRVEAVSEKRPIGIAYHSLRIYLNNKAGVRARQPLWNRLLATVAGGYSPGWLTVYRGLLDEPPETLAARITEYAQTNAVTGERFSNPLHDATGSSGDIWRV